MLTQYLQEFKHVLRNAGSVFITPLYACPRLNLTHAVCAMKMCYQLAIEITGADPWRPIGGNDCGN